MIYLFGYGSLINDESRRSTCKNSSGSIPVQISKDFKYRRVWKYRSFNSNYTALTLEKVSLKKASTINGVLFQVSEKDINDFDNREQGYTKINIPIKYINTYQGFNNNLLPDTDNVYTYISNNNNFKKASKAYPLKQNYIDTCIIGCLNYGDEFVLDFLNNTHKWSKYWINNRNTNLLNVNKVRTYYKIDNLLHKNPKIKLNYRIDIIFITKI